MTYTTTTEPDPTTWSIVQIVDGLRRREISAVEVVESFLARIRSVEDRVQAFVTICEDDSLRAAANADALLADHGTAGDLPLIGVPLGLKDLIETSGVRTTAGSKVLETHTPTEDAEVWTRLKEAGAILLGKTNTHEFAYGGSTEPTRNPWNLDRMTGGSSGGSAAALAAAMCPGAIGTDTAGSIRIPSAFCGVVGLKPTSGLVSRSGVIPLSQTLDHVGPMARSPIDVAILLDVMATNDETGRGPSEAGDPRSYVPVSGQDLAGLRIGVMADTGVTSSDVQRGFAQLISVCERAGAYLDDIDIGDFAHLTGECFTLIGAEAAVFHAQWLAHRSEEYTPYVRERLREASRVTTEDYQQALRTREALSRRCETMFNEVDLVILPGVPCVAPRAYETEITIDGTTVDRDFTECRNTCFANLAGIPALALPTGLSEDGLPVGAQICGPRFSDRQVLQVAQVAFERVGMPHTTPAIPTDREGAQQASAGR